MAEPSAILETPNAACLWAAPCVPFSRPVLPRAAVVGTMAGLVRTGWTWGWSSRWGSGHGDRSRSHVKDWRRLVVLHGCVQCLEYNLLASRRLAPTNSTGKLALQRLNNYGLLIRSTIGISIPSLVCTRKPTKVSRAESPCRDGRAAASASARSRGREKYLLNSFWDIASHGLRKFVTPKPQTGLTHRIMVKRLATSPHDPIGITDSAYSIGYPCTKESGESLTTKHRRLHALGPHQTSPPDDPN
ncbi:hypothetical protein F511_36304 [Dorcoceras hygrometricum]|uniref:Uncharacterized protein n=1 Tax=Dorcoceras hygrometricum TaxID=472368 RepID=A0A2Z7AKJ9_9LAMI|nr:hypothetical protein F511_36304 [Dorcoceras hygrometricum]